jgi:glycosyltransferase involved in cell wall biosynthesis
LSTGLREEHIITELSRSADKKKPHVLFVGAFPSKEKRIYGGIVTTCRVLMDSTFRNQFVLTLVDSTQINNPPPSFIIRLLLAIRRTARFIIKFESKNPDVILLFTSPGASVIEKSIMAWYGRIRGVPALIFPRGGALIDVCETSQFTRMWVSRAFSAAKKILCQGPQWQKFATNVCGFKIEDAPIIPNWTASPELLEIGSRRKWNKDSNDPLRFLFVGWVDKEKGIFELLETCKALSHSHQFTFTIAGMGTASEEAHEYVACHNLENRVKFLGWVEREQLPQLYSKNDIFVLPSYAEGLPNAMIEAMAAGLAVVVSDVGIVPDVIQDGYNGLLIKPKLCSSLTTAIQQLFDNPSMVEKLGAEGHITAYEQFSVEPSVEQLVATIHESISKS